MNDIKAAREAFLNLIADANDFGIDYDADTNDSGHMIDCSHYRIRGPLQSLRELCEVLGIQPKYEQSLDDAIIEAVEAPSEKESATEPKICSICQRVFQGYSCNAWPVNEGRCCSECDNTVVTPARIVISFRLHRPDGGQLTEKALRNSKNITHE